MIYFAYNCDVINNLASPQNDLSNFASFNILHVDPTNVLLLCSTTPLCSEVQLVNSLDMSLTLQKLENSFDVNSNHYQIKCLQLHAYFYFQPLPCTFEIFQTLLVQKINQCSIPRVIINKNNKIFNTIIGLYLHGSTQVSMNQT